MKLTILIAGENPEQLRGEFGQYADKFVRMFGGENSEFSFQTIAVYAGEPIPPVSELEGVIVSGSAYGAYDTPPWMDPLRTFIRAGYKADLPMLGICFGHQIIADALGGKVIKSEKGWSIGRHTYRLSDCPECFLAGPEQLAIAASHQDQVVVPPKNARVFLSSDFTPNAGLIYDNGMTISMQPHPEFEIAYSKAICNLRRNNPLDNESVDSAVASLDQPLDNEQVASAFTRFFLNRAKSTDR